MSAALLLGSHARNSRRRSAARRRAPCRIGVASFHMIHLVRLATHRCAAVRKEAKYSSVASKDKAGPCSLNALLIPAPKLAGADHAADVSARTDTHRSLPPSPPGRADVRINSRPAGRDVATYRPECLAWTSSARLVTPGARDRGPSHVSTDSTPN